ncbi:unnamed protein product [Bursaphelenchus xylophilus]|uniref:(pine wood nematode) hypothetical protein n=1 Tax=Bursaphelenchus xylophilus TaxID=6326 RepID=A0A1I7S4P2_BURXY|nr:unnamed protein product [Bursaphelenchus xylophilus]CAG9117269.1 unnamed protein product [Bursaphelenchus xylophilus]
MDAHAILRLITVGEILFHIPTISLTIYLVILCNRLSTFSANFKLIITVVVLSQSVVTVLQPLELYVPSSIYSVEEGHVIPAVIFYTAAVIRTFVSGFFVLKYLLLAVERSVAFKQRGSYEDRGYGLAIKCLGTSSMLSILFILVKTFNFYNSSKGMTLDRRLRYIFLIQYDLFGFLWIYNVAALTTVIAGLMFLRLHMAVKQHKFAFSLSERYEIRRTKYVISYMRRLMSAFVVLLIVCATCLSYLFYLKYWLGYSEEDDLMKIFLTIINFSACVYNFVTTLYMVAEFPQLARAMHDKIPFIIPKGKDVTVAPRQMGAIKEAEEYFRQLTDAWK